MPGLKQIPPIRWVLARRYRRYFETQVDTNLFYGVYPDFAAATRDMPRTKPAGYDNPEPAAMYGDRLTRVFPADYPVLFWLDRLVKTERSLFDFGGHVGIAYYSYRRYLKFSDDFKWTVYDVPAVREHGRKLAAEKRATGLGFADAVSGADGHDVFLASGALQYVESPDLAGMIGALGNPPRHVIVNKTPVHDSYRFVTLQNIGTAFCPYQIFKRSEFLEAMTHLGYRLVDSWANAETTCPIPYQPGRSVEAYSGFYFTKTGLRDWA